MAQITETSFKQKCTKMAGFGGKKKKLNPCIFIAMVPNK